jgi:arylsulfatase A-like enzyme
MRRRLKIWTLMIVAASATVSIGALTHAAPQGRGAAAQNRPPNILLIIMDDIGFDVTTDMYPGLIDDLTKKYGPAGLNHPKAGTIKGSPASTPNLDKLAKQGMVFTNVWAQPFCSPTRASILTGLFANKANVLTYADPLAQSYTSLVQKLKDEAGYSTAIFGKWHLAGLPGNPTSYPGMKPKEAGFELFKGNMHAAIKSYWDYEYMVQDAASPAGQWRTEAPPTKSLPGIAPTNYVEVVKVADTLEWITAQSKSNPSKPWLAWLAFNLSHATSQAQPSSMAVPNADTLDAKSYAEMQKCGGRFGSNNTGTCSGEALNRAMSNSLDTLIGKLLDQVDALDPNTYVILVGDNGTPMYGRPNLDFIDNMYITRKGRGKGTAYESGALVPMVIRGPRIAAASKSNDFVHVADLFSTTLALAGLKAPERVTGKDKNVLQTVDGVSLAPILFDKAASVRDPNLGYLLTESLNLMTNSSRQVGARNATYKVVCSEKVGTSTCEFFNLANDPLEEFPLQKPDSCSDYLNATWKASDPRWHYCRLTDVVATQSFLK